MFKIITLTIIVLVASVLIYAAMQTDTFRVQRTASINSPADKIFPLLNDMRSFNTWNPYEKKDPNMKGAYSGPRSGKGAEYAFDGNKEVGKGNIEITESSHPSKVTMNLNMIDPFEAHNVVEFTLQPVGDGTNVTWSMQGSLPYIAKVIHLLFDMDRMVGKDFEAGLANLKTIAEG
ncbi:MAG: SRPBCC family protein [Nitrospira sp.]|nr:SRPBCC family protein [Nitrospira sp.]